MIHQWPRHNLSQRGSSRSSESLSRGISTCRFPSSAICWRGMTRRQLDNPQPHPQTNPQTLVLLSSLATEVILPLPQQHRNTFSSHRFPRVRASGLRPNISTVRNAKTPFFYLSYHFRHVRLCQRMPFHRNFCSLSLSPSKEMRGPSKGCRSLSRDTKIGGGAKQAEKDDSTTTAEP
jgi:hypothetical protein